jgi:hypothetical protein
LAGSGGKIPRPSSRPPDSRMSRGSIGWIDRGGCVKDAKLFSLM